MFKERGSPVMPLGFMLHSLLSAFIPARQGSCFLKPPFLRPCSLPMLAQSLAVFFMAVAWAAPLSATSLAVVESLKATPREGVLFLSAPTKFRQGFLPPNPGGRQPARCYVDLFPAALGRKVPLRLALEGGPVEQVRTSRFRADVVRVVLDLGSPQECRAEILAQPDRLEVWVGAGKKGDPRGGVDRKPWPLPTKPKGEEGKVEVLPQATLVGFPQDPPLLSGPLGQGWDDNPKGWGDPEPLKKGVSWGLAVADPPTPFSLLFGGPKQKPSPWLPPRPQGGEVPRGPKQVFPGRKSMDGLENGSMVLGWLLALGAGGALVFLLSRRGGGRRRIGWEERMTELEKVVRRAGFLQGDFLRSLEIVQRRLELLLAQADLSEQRLRHALGQAEAGRADPYSTAALLLSQGQPAEKVAQTLHLPLSRVRVIQELCREVGLEKAAGREGGNGLELWEKLARGPNGLNGP